MDEVKTDGAEKQIVVEEKKADFVSVTDLKALLEENNKKWQSKFDTVLTEKKAVEGKALTTEQRLELIERERQEERLSWSRKEAKAKAQIDDELDSAIKLYSSNDSDKIQEGATLLRSTIDKVMAQKIDLAVAQALEKAGSQPKPLGGAEIPVGNSKEALLAKYEEAVKNKNGDAMLFYKDQLSRLKKG